MTTTAQTVTQTRYVGRGHPAAKAALQHVTQLQLHLRYHRPPQALEQAERLAGWRLSLTNAPLTQLSLPQAILDDRDEWLLERGSHRFKRGQLPALPIDCQNQDRIAGLMFLLTLALRVFTLMEFVGRLAFQTTQQALAGLYDGKPKRETNRPSAAQ